VRERAIPEATVARLPLYLRSLVDMTERGMQTISSEGLAEAAGVTCVFHCAHDLGLKTAAMLHVVASSPGFTPSTIWGMPTLE